MKKKINLEKIGMKFLDFTMGFLAIIVIFAIISLCHIFLVEITKTEINSYTIESEITRLEYTMTGHSNNIPQYIIGIKNEEFSDTIEISSSEYARYNKGDKVKIEVKTLKDITGNLHREYKLLE